MSPLKIEEKRRKTVGVWLLTLAGMILVNVVLGGLTRLTGSGLSMVEWQPLTVLPPLTDGAWADMFAKYQDSPQFQLVNDHMDLAGFKDIFWLEFIHRNWGRLLGFAFLIPFLFWNMMIGFVVYVHHTHPEIDWYDDKAAWAAAQPFVSTTVHLTFDRVLGVNVSALLHHIMEHTAHHVDMRVPLYHLAAAQKILETRLPGRIVIQRFSWRWYFDTARRCKLYDIQQRCWTDFSGRPTLARTLTQ